MKRHTSRIITQQCSPAIVQQGSHASYAIAAKGAITVSDATLQQTKALYDRIAAKDPEQKQFLQAFSEVTSTLLPVFERNPKYLRVMETMAEPEQVHTFRVAWLDDKGNQRVNRGFRVQFNSAIGPYKGGLRLHPSVNLSIIKFLGFEQVFKNSLTSLPMGGGKGGSDFDPKGKSDNEVMRFCQSFMNSLHHYIGPNQDVPAGDIGVGAREIGYLFGQYKHLTNRFEGVLTGKALNWGGSLIRPEATGYGAVYFAEEIMKEKGLEFKGKKCLISGSGNVAEYCAEKLLSEGAKVLTLSDSDGFVFEPNGFTNEQLDIVRDIKKVKRERISEYAKFSKTAQYFPKEKPWKVPCDLAFPCATENEIDGNAATTLAKNGCLAVIEGANMPSTNEAVSVYHANKVLYAPAKAANAGGVATSGLEMSQNSIRLSWTREEVDARLRGIMRNIFKQAKDAATEYGQPDNIQMGANIAGFLKVADSMIDQGCL